MELEYKVIIANHKEKNELKYCEFDFHLSLSEDKEEGYLKGKYESSYAVYIKTDLEENKLIEHEVLRHMEPYIKPYIKQGVLEFATNAGIPGLTLPYEFWKYAKN